MDKINISNDKLTPSAKEALNDTMLEFQMLLLDKATSIAQRDQTADKEISLRDILEAKENLFKIKTERDKADYRRKRIMTLISLSGALYSMIGIFVYLFQNQKFTLDKNLGLVIAFLGIIVIFTGFTYTLIFPKKNGEKFFDYKIQYEDPSYSFEIIKRWQMIEKLGSNLMKQKGYSTNKSNSINDILKFLSFELKNEKLYIEMRNLLSIRNKIVHEGYELSRQEKHFYLDIANKIIEQLEFLEKQ